MSIADRIQAINDHLIDDYSVLRLAGADLTGVNKNIVNLKMSWKERLLYFMNNGTQEVWDNWNKVSGTGTTLSLNNTEEAPMSLVYKGNTSQNGTPTPTTPIPVQVVSGDNSIEVCGLNIAQKELGLGTYGGSETTTVITDYAGREYSLVEIKPSTQYTILRQNTNSTNFRYFFYDTKPIKNTTLSIGGGYINDTSASKTFTTPSNAKWLFVQWSADGTNYSAGNIQIALGTSTTYQPYKSASYPISLGDKELCKIGTYQDKIDKSTGRNLCGYDNTLPYTNGGVTLTRENGYYKTTGTASTVWFYKNVYTIPAGTLNGTYRVKKFLYSGTNEAQIRVIDRTVTPAVTYVETKDSNTFTISNNNTLNVEISVRLNYASNETFNFILQDANETNLEYEPYGTSWYLKKEIGKVVLNGSESWYKYSDYTYYILGITEIRKSLSNYYAYQESKQTAGALLNGEYCWASASNLYSWLFKNTDIETVADFKTWLTTHNTTVYYVLATPTYEYITDTTLIEQLEALKKSYEEQTNISQTNNDMPFELSVTALEVMS